MTKDETQDLKEALIKFEEREKTEKYFMKGISLGGGLWVGIVAWAHYFQSLDYMLSWMETIGQIGGVCAFVAIIWHIIFLHNRKQKAINANSSPAKD